jgi:hypothetical protein
MVHHDICILSPVLKVCRALGRTVGSVCALNMVGPVPLTKLSFRSAVFGFTHTSLLKAY